MGGLGFFSEGCCAIGALRFHRLCAESRVGLGGRRWQPEWPASGYIALAGKFVQVLL